MFSDIFFSVRYCEYYDESRNDPAFYTWDTPEWVCTVEVKDRLLEVWSVGEMRINLPNDSIVRYADDLFSAGIETDEDLYEIDEACWVNNSWLEIRDYEGQWIGDVFSGHIFHDVNEAISGCAALLEEEEFLAEYPCLNPDYAVG